MASINKLSIRGVRSFSPDADEQVLEFFFPCTIIVGANGCGKTTIIESLKFAVSGSLPPGKNPGQSFVHDPRSIGHSSVKANIKLRFTNRAGSSMVVVRSMELEKKKTKLTFKQLDGALRTVDKDGNRQALSHKCSELDKQIPLLLGVSKAILEHVVFCHQEDSSWPLQDAAVVKKRFDDIFDSSRYTKALEVFAKLKKEYASKVKDLKADLAGLASHRHAAKGFRKDMETYNGQLEDLEDEISDLRSEIKENEKEEERIKAIIDQVDDIKNDIDVQKNGLAAEEKIHRSRRTMLNEDLTEKHSIRELKDMLRDFETEIGEQVDKQKDLKEEIEDLHKDLKRVRKEREEMQSTIGRLQAAKENHETVLKQRFDTMMSIGQRYCLGDVLTPITQTQLSQTQNTSYNASSMGDTSVSVHESGQQPVLDISQADMEEFYRALDKKEKELTEEYQNLKSRNASQLDQISSQLTNIGGQLQSIENDKRRLEKESAAARKEIAQISTELSRSSRLRKADVEEAKKNALETAKRRDEANDNPRRTQNPIEIRSLEEKMDKLKREIEDDKMARDMLRHSAEAQNAIVVLKEQSSKELESLEDSVKDLAYAFQQYNVENPGELPRAGEDASGEELTQIISNIVDEFSDKYQGLTLEQSKAQGEVNRLQKAVSENQALLAHNQRALSSKKATMVQLDGKNGSIDKIKQVAIELRQFESEQGVTTPASLDESKPQELHSYLEAKLHEEESMSTEGIQPADVRKIMKKLLKQARRSGEFACPCCKRSLDSEQEVGSFQEQLKFLGSDDSPLIKLDETSKIARANYQRWKQIVSDNKNDVMEYRRLVNEANDLEGVIEELASTLSEKQQQLEQADGELSDLQNKVEELREYLDTSKRWTEAASRIAEKRMQVNQKQTDLSMSSSDFGGRDLKTVENDYAEKSERLSQYMDKIGKLNKEMQALNNLMSQLQGQANRTEKLARDKEEKFGNMQKLQEKKVTLNETMAKCKVEEDKLKDATAPLRQKEREKQNERKRMRALGEEEEQRLNDAVNSFSNEVVKLKSITEDIDRYKESNNEEEFDRVSRKSEELLDRSNQVQSRIESKQPDLDRLNKAIADQESHKKNLQQNMELIASGKKIEAMKESIAKLEEDAGKVEGQDTCDEDWDRLTTRKQDILSSIARLEGRRGEIVENIRSQKRKLSAPEYKNVEEEHRVAIIKHETTQMAVRDLEKYHTALDKALLKFHGLKIAEINKIIRELWTLTYKGEDITGIELVSGQEAGSRAARNYNYRVVMTKGSTQLDMRGRCSAGQRVLACIVVRLALAETFCLNFGCIALDEPTVNLDYNNKRGLAIALAQITAARASQQNFQLILITHDEDFVAMMKTELSTLSGFTMPEKYFQVRREAAADGKYYSKIDSVDWDELL